MASRASRAATDVARAAAIAIALSAPVACAAAPPPAPQVAPPPSAAVAAVAASPSTVWHSVDLSSRDLDHHLLHSGLKGEGGVEHYSYESSADGLSLRSHARLGAAACGHRAFVHGGALAALLDDSMGALFIGRYGPGVTANLNIDYRRPVPHGTELRVVCTVVKVERSSKGAQKVTLAARIEDAGAGGGAPFTEATALFIAKPALSVLLAGGSSGVLGAAMDWLRSWWRTSS